MKKGRLIVALYSGILLIAALYLIDYKNLVDRSNLGMFLLAIVCILNIITMILSNRYDKKK